MFVLVSSTGAVGSSTDEVESCFFGTNTCSSFLDLLVPVTLPRPSGGSTSPVELAAAAPPPLTPSRRFSSLASTGFAMSLSPSRGIFEIFDRNCGVVGALPGDMVLVIGDLPAERLQVVDEECRELAPGIPASLSRFF
jgi:hypothetical protein